MEPQKILVKNLEEQNNLRAKHKNKRNKLTQHQIEVWSNTICNHIILTEVYQKAEFIMAYYPLGSEASLLPLIMSCLKDQKSIAFPRVEGDTMEFYEIHDLSELQEGYFHVMEPVTKKIVQWEHGLVLTPGLVFDEKGGRIGYGKGFYDKYFALHPAYMRMGIAFEQQLEKRIPMNSMDIPMQWLITEKRLCRIMK